MKNISKLPPFFNYLPMNEELQEQEIWFSFSFHVLNFPALEVPGPYFKKGSK